jgi:hypothetical protein
MELSQRARARVAPQHPTTPPVLPRVRGVHAPHLLCSVARARPSSRAPLAGVPPSAPRGPPWPRQGPRGCNDMNMPPPLQAAGTAFAAPTAPWAAVPTTVRTRVRRVACAGRSFLALRGERTTFWAHTQPRPRASACSSDAACARPVTHRVHPFPRRTAAQAGAFCVVARAAPPRARRPKLFAKLGSETHCPPAPCRDAPAPRHHVRSACRAARPPAA